MTYYTQVEFTVGDYKYNNYNNSNYDNGVICEPVDKTKTSYETIQRTVTYQGITYDVIGASFAYCKKMTSVPKSNAQFREVQKPGYSYLYGGVEQAFGYCESLTDISEFVNWDLTSAPTVTNEHYTSFAVTEINTLFVNCKSLTDISPLEHLDISKMRMFNGVFIECISLSDITPLTDWDTSGIFSMSRMFDKTSISDLTPLENWDLSGINTGTGIFATTSGLGSMFAYTNVSDLTPLANWDISNVRTLDNMFRECTLLSDLTPLSNWDTSNVRSMYYMFSGTVVSDLTPLANWDTSKVTDIASMFYKCKNITSTNGIGSWDTGSFEDMRGMFNGCTSLIDVSAIASWNISSATRLDNFFKNCTSLPNVSLLNWDYTSATNVDNMFQNCTSLSGNINVKNTSASLTNTDMFTGTVNNIYIVNKDQNPNNIKAYWQAVASSYANVHYEADDNTVPSLSYNIVRVGAMNSETQVENGEYAYINATAVLFNDYLPTGWSVALGDKTLTLDTVTQTPIWTDTNVDYVYTLKCWQPLGDTARHTFTLQISNNITNESSVLKASHLSATVTKTLSKAYKLVDYYHESDPNDPNYDTEGMAVGKFATEANLFDVDMPTLFRQDVSLVDRDSITRLLFDYVYPIGSYYETSDTTFDPNDTWGGTWVLENPGLVHVSSGTGYAVGVTGGSETHVHTTGDCTLNANQIPYHTHTMYYDYWTVSTGSGTQRQCLNINAGAASYSKTTNAQSGSYGSAHNHGNTGSTSNMQPYIVVNRWHRTA